MQRSQISLLLTHSAVLSPWWPQGVVSFHCLWLPQYLFAAPLNGKRRARKSTLVYGTPARNKTKAKRQRTRRGNTKGSQAQEREVSGVELLTKTQRSFPAAWWRYVRTKWLKTLSFFASFICIRNEGGTRQANLDNKNCMTLLDMHWPLCVFGRGSRCGSFLWVTAFLSSCLASHSSPSPPPWGFILVLLFSLTHHSLSTTFAFYVQFGLHKFPKILLFFLIMILFSYTLPYFTTLSLFFFSRPALLSHSSFSLNSSFLPLI